MSVGVSFTFLWRPLGFLESSPLRYFSFIKSSQHDFASKSSKIPASLIWGILLKFSHFQVAEDTLRS